jgi:transposase-like protein
LKKYNAGESLEAIAKSLGIGISTTRKWKHEWEEAGLQLCEAHKFKAFGEDVEARALRLLAEGKALAVVAKETGTSTSTVGFWRLRDSKKKTAIQEDMHEDLVRAPHLPFRCIYAIHTHRHLMEHRLQAMMVDRLHRCLSLHSQPSRILLLSPTSLIGSSRKGSRCSTTDRSVGALMRSPWPTQYVPPLNAALAI